MKRTPGPIFAVSLAACLGDVEVPPEPPKLQPVMTPTSIARVSLRGSKTKGTGVLLGGTVIVPPDDEESFTHELELQIGTNHLVFAAQRASGLMSRKTTELDVEYAPLCPGAPTLEPVPRYTQQSSLMLRGTKPPKTAIELDGTELVPLDDAMEWTAPLELGTSEASFNFNLQARDSRGQKSDAIRFSVRRDTTPPAIRVRHPRANARGVPANARVWIAFEEELSFPTGAPDQGIVTVEGPAGTVLGATSYEVDARALVFASQALPANATLTVTIDPTLLEDLAGNRGIAASGGPWSWTFTTTAAADSSSPPPPGLDPPPAMTFDRTITLRGTKAANTGISVDRRLVASVDPDTTWTFALALPIGTSSVTVAAVSPTGATTALPAFDVRRDEMRPAAPVVTSPPMMVAEPSVVLSGQKAAGTSILLAGRAVVCRGPETSWSFSTPLAPGTNELALEAEDESGTRSDPVVVRVVYERMFAGRVPDGWTLKLSLALRDIAAIPGVREEFVTGANNYGLDIWVEGPIAPEDTCVIENGQRKNIRYVATIEHYIGAKAQHTNPFADEDYRGGDYLAAMISGGVFSFRGLGPDTVRRDGAGRELPGLMGGVTEADLREHIDCLGQPGVDVCTHATTRAESRNIAPWTPRKRGDSELLEQGEYLLFVQINLDRSGAWLTANDFETCWGTLDDADRGMHRIVRRVALGGDPFTIVVPREEEQSGPDRDGAEKLRFVEPPGLTISWGP